MLSLEPATITGERYPLLFQTGETAYGKPIVDGQHPHNFIMGLGFHYTYQVTEDTFLSAYFAPVGDPALGPVAFPHRASAMELPQAPISHHWQDSTHISDEVVTVGISHRKLRLEASGFPRRRTRREPVDHSRRSHRLLGYTTLVFPNQELGGASFRWKDHSSRGAGTGGPGAFDGVLAVHQADAGRKLGINTCLGAQPRHRHASQSEFLSG